MKKFFINVRELISYIFSYWKEWFRTNRIIFLVSLVLQTIYMFLISKGEPWYVTITYSFTGAFFGTFVGSLVFPKPKTPNLIYQIGDIVIVPKISNDIEWTIVEIIHSSNLKTIFYKLQTNNFELEEKLKEINAYNRDLTPGIKLTDHFIKKSNIKKPKPIKSLKELYE